MLNKRSSKNKIIKLCDIKLKFYVWISVNSFKYEAHTPELVYKNEPNSVTQPELQISPIIQMKILSLNKFHAKCISRYIDSWMFFLITRWIIKIEELKYHNYPTLAQSIMLPQLFEKVLRLLFKILNQNLLVRVLFSSRRQFQDIIPTLAIHIT